MLKLLGAIGAAAAGVAGGIAASVGSTAVGSLTGELAEQYKEYFYCDAMSADTLVMKGVKRKSGGLFGGNKGSDNIITEGSIIAVADGQCMMIVEQGKVVELCAETGYYQYDASSEPSLLVGPLGQGLKDFWDKFKERFAFGGTKPKDQRIYYFNLKEIIGNKYGTPNAVPFRVVDERAGIDIDISVRCFGEYSYKLTNPVLFYTNVCGNVSAAYTRDQLDSQLKSEFLTALQPAFARISEMGIRYSALPGHTTEMAQAMNEALSAKWRDLRGIEVVSVGVSSVKASDEDEAMLKAMQKDAAYMDPRRAAAALTGAQADAMRTAAGNAGGAAMGFMGMNMAAQSGGMNAAQLYQMAGQQQYAQPVQQAQPAQQYAQAAQASASSAGDTWTCPKCGAAAHGKFCTECGTKKPEAASGWTCPKCGHVNTGKFCMECGAAKPSAVTACPKCGWTVPNPAQPPKFCPECGNAF
ncbi:MAG: SPFH domain-containing protein [Oscillibacter sp.]|nr:SPFH domain-containing protein [Oscillibacter sp.]